MSEWYFWVAPLAVLAVFLLFRFVGCDQVFGLDDYRTGPYGNVIRNEDGIVSFWRLHELQSEQPLPPTMDNTPVTGGVAFDEKQANVTGHYKAVRVVANGNPPDTPDAPGILSLEAAGLLDIPDGEPNTSVQVDGGFVEIPFSASLSLTSFSVEAIVFPEWDPNEIQRVFRTVISFISPAAKVGFLIYAGPNDPADATSPYVWQVWLGDGSQFVRVDYNHGTLPLVGFTTANYLAVTYDSPSQKLNMYTYVKGINLDHGAFNPIRGVSVTSLQNTDPQSSLFIGIERTTPPVYPFKGRIQDVAIYNTALVPRAVISHIGSGFDIAD